MALNECLCHPARGHFEHRCPGCHRRVLSAAPATISQPQPFVYYHASKVGRIKGLVCQYEHSPWREHIDRRVLLIGGPPGAGKTTLGRAVGAVLGWPSLTVDDLVVGIKAMTTPQAHPALYPMANLGHTRYFTENGPEQLIADAEALAQEVWPAVERVIRFHATVKDSIVIDWWLLDPDRVAELGLDNVRSAWLHVDPGELHRREASNLEFLDGSADPELMLRNFMGRSLWRNELVRSKAERSGLPVIHQAGGRSVPELVNEVISRTGLGRGNTAT